MAYTFVDKTKTQPNKQLKNQKKTCNPPINKGVIDCSEQQFPNPVVHSLTDTIKNTTTSIFNGRRNSMKLNKSLMAVALAFVITLSLLALVQRQRDAETSFQLTIQNAKTEHTIYPLTHISILTFPTALNLQSTIAEKAPLPENSTRTEIYNFINANPGVQFRAICSSLGLSIGTVQFHIAILQKTGLITFIRQGKYKRFFTARNYTKKQMETIATLRLNTVKNILKTLLQGKHISHHQLAMHLSISSQGLTWQMNRLRETGLIQENRNGINVTYTIDQTQLTQLTKTITYIEQN